MFFQGPVAVAEHQPRHGPEQDAVFLGHLVDVARKDAAWLVEQLALRAGLHQADDGVEQVLAIAREGLGPDDEIHLEAFLAPVRVGLHQVADEIEIGGVGDGQQDNGPVA